MASRNRHRNETVTSQSDRGVTGPPNRSAKPLSRHAVDANDPIARAEQALAALSVQFSGWMDSECARLDAARRAIRDQGFTRRTRDVLFRAAHDIKGEAETFGFPLAAAAAASLCRLMNGVPEGQAAPLILIDQHVDAVKAIVRGHAQPNAVRMATRLTDQLHEVTTDFLKSGISCPPTVPRTGN